MNGIIISNKKHQSPQVKYQVLCQARRVQICTKDRVRVPLLLQLQSLVLSRINVHIVKRLVIGRKIALYYVSVLSPAQYQEEPARMMNSHKIKEMNQQER